MLKATTASEGKTTYLAMGALTGVCVCRSEENKIIIPEYPSLSRTQAIIDVNREDGVFVIRDLGSNNATRFTFALYLCWHL